MSSCCSNPVDHKSGQPATLTVALAGNPNSGKTTLFNALTGLRQKVGNFAGVTVDRHEGSFTADGRRVSSCQSPMTATAS
jgi:ferrous iron transport protein B